MEKIVQKTLLFDFYSELLTNKQKELYQAYYLDDLSLSEIGERFSVSRQAVHDNIYRTEKKLNELEAKLKLVEKYNKSKNIIDEMKKIIDSMPDAQKLKQLLNGLEGLE